MTRRILFCTIGATPQVVTETVWALRNTRTPPWIPDEIHLVTTTFALSRIRKELQSPAGHLATLLGVPNPRVTIHVPCRDGTAVAFEPMQGHWDDMSGSAAAIPAEGALQDVNSADDAIHMGALIFRLTAQFTHDPHTELHISLAGGRKTMSAHALVALSLVGRLQDEATHVLVSPSAFEDNPTFWYPGQPENVTIRVPNPEAKSKFKEVERESRDASVVLVPTAVPILRHEVRSVEGIEKLDLNEVVSLQNLALRLQRDPAITLDTSTNRVTAGGISRQLNPKSFAIYRLLATARREGWPGVGPNGEGEDHRGWMSVPHAIVGQNPKREPIDRVHLRYLSQAVDVAGGETRAIDPTTGKAHPNEHQSLKEWRLNVVEEVNLKIKLGNAQTALGSCTRLIEELQGLFGNAAIAIIGPVVEDRRQKTRFTSPDRINPTGWTRFGLLVPPEGIDLQ